MSGGILGMFIGAALLATVYQVFMKWVDAETQDVAAEIDNTDPPKKELEQPKDWSLSKAS